MFLLQESYKDNTYEFVCEDKTFLLKFLMKFIVQKCITRCNKAFKIKKYFEKLQTKTNMHLKKQTLTLHLIVSRQGRCI